jgi:DNA-binding helix-hairpin-helix protein with protein kinase domain
MTSKLLSSSRSITLASEIGRGGEGVVLSVVEYPNWVAKVYSTEVSSQRTNKLKAMVHLRNDRIQNLCAWPTDLIVDRADRVVGFVMPRVSKALDVHKLYGPTSRQRDFPDVGMRALLYAARNLASAFSVVHNQHCVIGDINDRSALIAPDMTVKLIDCDSFQISDRGQLYSCDVGTPTHQPPELQGVSTFRGLARTPNHDNFGLAVQIFQLIFLGRHPYDGRAEGQDVADTASRIKMHMFMYGKGAAAKKLKPPPYALPLDHYGPELASMFERAFSPVSCNGGRPTAGDWVSTLTELAQGKLGRCKHNRAHFAASGTRRCEICAIERVSGALLFLPPPGSAILSSSPAGGRSSAAQQLRVEILQLRSQLTGGRLPTPDDLTSSVTATPAPPSINPVAVRVVALAVLVGSILASSKVPMAFLAGLAGAVILWALSNNKDRARKSRADALLKAELKYRDAANDWSILLSGEDLRRAEEEVRNAERRAPNLQPERQNLLQRARDNERGRQLKAFLEQFSVASADINQIGRARLTALRSYRIETAADITQGKLLSVPGIGPKRAMFLMNWKDQIQKRFSYNAQSALPKSVLDQVDQEFIRISNQASADVDRALSKLKYLLAERTKKREEVLAAARDAAAGVAQARADLASIN